MSSITVHVINKEGYWDCTRTGNVDNVMYAVNIEDKDFTLVAPPDILGGWRWVSNEWIADETAN